MKEKNVGFNEQEPKDLTLLKGKSVSRRDFLKIAGIAGATIGVGAGLGGLVAACGGSTTTTTAATTATTAAATDTTAVQVDTTVTAAAEMGREVKMGIVSPVTGPLADFAIPDKYIADKWKAAVGDGLVLGDNKKHPITFKLMDSQSDTNRAATVAGDLIQNDKIDMMLVSSAPDTVNPVADTCEAMGTPCLSTDCPMEPYYFGRGATPDKPFKWTYLAFWGNYEMMADSKVLWTALPTNKKIATAWSNEVDGNARRDSLTPLIKEMGFTQVDGGAYQAGQEDFTSMISLWKKEGCEILCCMASPPDFTNLWTQCRQQGFIPKIADVAKASLFPKAMEAIGTIGFGISGPQWWHPTFPWKSQLTGETCQELATDFEKTTGFEWSQPLMHYVTFEWAADVLKRTTNVDDKEEIIKNVAATKLAESVAGPLDFTAPLAPNSAHIVPNVVGTPLYEGEWVKGTKQWPWSSKIWEYDMKIVTNTMAPQVTVQGPLEPITA